ncbi:MAG: outer membrane lipoprotein-sorting protein [Kiritimatiellia bacterium]
MARATSFPLRQSRRVAFAALAAFAALVSDAQIPAGELDADEYVLRSAPLPEGDELMARVRARLPAEPLDLLARVSTHDPATGKKIDFRAEVGLRFGANPPTATYALMDAFGVVREQLDLTWAAGGKPQYRIRRGADLQEVPNVDAARPIEGLEFAWADLSLAFLWWEGAETVDRESMKLRGCYVVEVPAPAGTSGISKVRLWVDRKESFLMRARLYGANDVLLREVEADSIEQIGEIWMVKNLEIKTYPSRKKTRIVVDEVKRLAPESAKPQEGLPDAEGH